MAWIMILLCFHIGIAWKTGVWYGESILEHDDLEYDLSIFKNDGVWIHHDNNEYNEDFDLDINLEDCNDDKMGLIYNEHMFFWLDDYHGP